MIATIYSKLLGLATSSGPVLCGLIAAVLGIVWLVIALFLSFLGWKGFLGAILGLALYALGFAVYALCSLFFERIKQ